MLLNPPASPGLLSVGSLSDVLAHTTSLACKPPGLPLADGSQPALSAQSSLFSPRITEADRAAERKAVAVATRQPLNELVIQRHLSSMALLQLFVDGVLVTTIRADGVIVATPTGKFIPNT